MNSRYVISLENNLSRKPGVEEVIRTNPRAAIGSRYEKGKRYALTHNPESVASVLLSCEEEQIRRIETQLKECGLQTGASPAAPTRCSRACSRRRTTAGSRSPRMPPTPAVARAGSMSCVAKAPCAPSCRAVNSGPSCAHRSDIYTDSLDPVIDLLQPLTARLESGSELYIVADSDDTGIADQLRGRLDGVKIEDLSKPQHLWRVLAEI